MRKRRVNTRWRRVAWIVSDFASGTVREEVRWVQRVTPEEFIASTTKAPPTRR